VQPVPESKPIPGPKKNEKQKKCPNKNEKYKGKPYYAK